jgi:aryl-alcohol dehydrogenase-like predicted oxidoreductase
MQHRKLGTQGLDTSAMGLGCMGMSDFYGDRSDQGESVATIHRALELGVNFLDTADMYGPHTNEQLVAKAIKGKREKFVIATKFGIVRDANDPLKRGINGRPEYVRASVEGSLKRLGVDTIDLYYQHRVDTNTPIEDTVGEMGNLVREGKIKYIGLSEAGTDTLKRAAAVHPIAALQTEYSLWSREPEDEIIPTCRALGIGFIPYSPLGRGFLTGAYKSIEDFRSDDFRRSSPRFQGENFAKNLELVRHIQALATEKGCTPGQLALAWVMAQGNDMVPIPGTKRREFLEENVGAVNVTLTPQDLARIDEVAPKGAAIGDRYHPESMKMLGR